MSGGNALKPVEQKYFADLHSWQAVCNRFALAVDKYCEKEGISRRELAEQWKVNERHLSSIIREHKPVTVTMLQAAARHGINLNFVMANDGPIHIKKKTIKS